MSALYAIRCFYGGGAKVMLPFLVVSGYAFVETSYAVIAERSIGDVPDAFVANWTVAKTPPTSGPGGAAISCNTPECKRVGIKRRTCTEDRPAGRALQ